MMRPFENYQRQLWPVLGALARRGYIAQPADGNDIIHDFFLDQWPLLQRNYDSQRGPFERYLYGAFYRYARRRIARFHAQQRRMVEISSALSLTADDLSAEDTLEASDRVAEMREALARLPGSDRLVLERFLSDASQNERELARQLGMTRYRLRETMADAVGRLAVELNTLEPHDALEHRVAMALWRDGKDVGMTAAELGISIPEVHAVRKRVVKHLLNSLHGTSTRKSSRREAMFSTKEESPKPLDLLKLALLSKDNADLLLQVQSRATEILNALDEEDQEFSESERNIIAGNSEWLSKVYEILGSDDRAQITQTEAEVEESIARILRNEEAEIGEAFSVLIDTLPFKFRNWPSWFGNVPCVSKDVYQKLSARWPAKRAGQYADGLLVYGITPASIFEATLGVCLLLERCSAEMEYRGSYDFHLMLVPESHAPAKDGAVQIPQKLLMAQMLANPDCPPQAAPSLLNWLLAVAAVKPHLFEGYRVTGSSKDCLSIVSAAAAASPVELMQRWSEPMQLAEQQQEAARAAG